MEPRQIDWPALIFSMIAVGLLSIIEHRWSWVPTLALAFGVGMWYEWHSNRAKYWDLD